MLDDVIGRIGRLEEQATVKTIFGEPIREHGRTIIPVGRVAYGFGFGGGRNAEPAPEDPARERGTRTGGGGGGGLRIAPVALLEMTDAGTKVRPVVDVTRVVLAGMALAAWNVFWITLTVRAVARARR